MVKALVSGILKLVIALINIVLLPLNLLIQALIPDLSTAFGYVTGFFNYLGNVSSWVMSYTGLTSEVISIIVAIIIATITIPLAVHMIKLVVIWFDKLKVG